MCIIYTYELRCSICSTVITAKVSYHECADLRRLRKESESSSKKTLPDDDNGDDNSDNVPRDANANANADANAEAQGQGAAKVTVEWGDCGKEIEQVSRVDKKLGVACVGGCEAFPTRKGVTGGKKE